MQTCSIKTLLQVVAVSLLLIFSLASVAEPKVTDKVNRALIGSIENGHYVSRDKSFSFKLPIESDSQVVIDSITNTLSSTAEVIAIHSKNESTNYRFEVSHAIPGKKNNSHFTQATAKTFDWYRRLVQRAWKAPLTEIYTNEFETQGHKAAHAIYKQFADKTSGPHYHIFYLADYNDRINFLWTHISLPEENLEMEDIILEAKSGPALKAKQSFLSFQLN